MRWFEAEGGEHPGRLGGDEIARRWGADLLVGDHHDAHRTVVEVGDLFERRFQDDESALHVEDAGTVDDAVLFTPGHRVAQLPDRPDGVVVPEEEQRRLRGPRPRPGKSATTWSPVGAATRRAVPPELAIPGEEPVGERVQSLAVTGRRLVPDVLPKTIMRS